MKKNQSLTITTLNTQGILAFSLEYLRKCQEIATYNNSYEVDIINFQEVFFYHHFFYLKKLLTAFPYYIYKASLFGPKAGLVTFSRIPLQFCSYKAFKKQGSGWNRSIINVLGGKGILLSRVNNTDIFIMNTHFSANFSNDWNTENQDVLILKNQIKEFHGFVSKLRNTCIITGDFNIHKKSFLYAFLIKNGLHDAFKNIYKTTHRGDMFVQSIKDLQVDYILYNNKNLLVNSKKYIFQQKFAVNVKRNVFVSDHVGLEAKFIIKLYSFDF